MSSLDNDYCSCAYQVVDSFARYELCVYLSSVSGCEDTGFSLLLKVADTDQKSINLPPHVLPVGEEITEP